MAVNLRARLQRIREAAPPRFEKKDTVSSPLLSEFPGGEWVEAACQTLRRTVYFDFSRSLPVPFPRTLGILIPDLFRCGMNWSLAPEDPLFFDLETTGLSGGAGTIAFLAAFGRFVPPESSAASVRLRLDQYLLLDYPGEAGFLQALLSELGASVPPLIVTYNGKCFDAPLLTTRCLMHGLRPPVFAHADLLHPSRRLWKRFLPSCSQGTIETSVLGLDRAGDLSGAMAPEMWFSFLRGGGTEGLLEVCKHNSRDILGLAHLFACMVQLAEDPLKAAETITYDMENLALHWWKLNRRSQDPLGEAAAATGRALLETAAARGYPQARYAAARDLMNSGDFDKGRRRLLEIAVSPGQMNLRAAAYRALAVDAERRLRNTPAALFYTEAALALEGLSSPLSRDLTRRRQRLCTVCAEILQK